MPRARRGFTRIHVTLRGGAVKARAARYARAFSGLMPFSSVEDIFRLRCHDRVYTFYASYGARFSMRDACRYGAFHFFHAIDMLPPPSRFRFHDACSRCLIHYADAADYIYDDFLLIPVA